MDNAARRQQHVCLLGAPGQLGSLSQMKKQGLGEESSLEATQVTASRVCFSTYQLLGFLLTLSSSNAGTKSLQ